MRPASKPPQNSQRKRPPATTPEARENQLAALAYDLAEKQLRDGTASSQVISHFLNAVSTRDRLEKELLEKQKELATAKTESYQSSKDIKVLYKEALDAMRTYSGNNRGDDDDNNG